MTKTKLLIFNFDKFVKLLTQVYSFGDHLWPQNNITTLHFGFITFKIIQVDKILKIESNKDMNFASINLELDLTLNIE